MNDSPFVLLDGGLSTALEGFGVDTSSDLWTAEAVWRRPDIVVAAHRVFVEAGADVVTTASYQCDVDLLIEAGLDARSARDVLASTTDLARRGSEGSRALVAASVGPFGASLADGSEYSGRYPVPWSVVESFHRRRLEVLVDTGPDLFAVETIPRGDEAALLADLLVEFGTPKVWFSFGCATSERTYGGDDLRATVAEVVDYPNLLAIGVNCVAPRIVSDALDTLESFAVPFVVYPNHGRTWNVAQRVWVGDSHDLDDALVDSWLERGARFVGGCCGTGPDEIARLAAMRSRLARRGEFT
jgi:S-methylmethionine-dependent homocysteine/selenocysteine methylase